MGGLELKEEFFCFFTIYNDLSHILTICFLCLSISIILYGLRSYLKFRLLNNRNILIIYFMTLSWWIAYVVYNLYGICLFNILDDESLNQDASDDSKYLFVLNWLNQYLMQLLLLYVPYHLAKLIVNLFSKSSQSEATVQQQYSGYQKKISLLLKYYIKIRLIFIVLPILFLLLTDENVIFLLFKMILWSLSVDCIIIIGCLSFGMISLKTNVKLKQALDEQSLKMLFYRYLLIIIANSFRLTFDLIHVILKVFNDQSFAQVCPHFDSNNFTQDTTFLIFECLLTQFLPIIMILKIFKYQQPENLQITKSLLVSVSSDQDDYSIN